MAKHPDLTYQTLRKYSPLRKVVGSSYFSERGHFRFMCFAHYSVNKVTGKESLSVSALLAALTVAQAPAARRAAIAMPADAEQVVGIRIPDARPHDPRGKATKKRCCREGRTCLRERNLPCPCMDKGVVCHLLKGT